MNCCAHSNLLTWKVDKKKLSFHKKPLYKVLAPAEAEP